MGLQEWNYAAANESETGRLKVTQRSIQMHQKAIDMRKNFIKLTKV